MSSWNKRRGGGGGGYRGGRSSRGGFNSRGGGNSGRGNSGWGRGGSGGQQQQQQGGWGGGRGNSGGGGGYQRGGQGGGGQSWGGGGRGGRGSGSYRGSKSHGGSSRGGQSWGGGGRGRGGASQRGGSGWGGGGRGGGGAAASGGGAGGELPRNALQCLEIPMGEGSDTIQALAWTPEPGKNYVVCGGWDYQVRCFEVETDGSGRPKAAHSMTSLTTLTAPVLDVAFHGDGKTVFAAGCDNQVTMWDMHSGATQIVAQHDAPIKGVEYMRNFSGLVTAGWDAKVRLWDCRTEKPQVELALSERIVSMSAAQDASAPLLVAATADKLFHCYDVRNPSTPLLPPLASQLEMPTRCVKAFPTGAGYASSSIGGRCAIRHNVWNGTGDTPASDPTKGDFTFKCHRISERHGQSTLYPVNALALHPYETDCIATAGSDGSFHFWNKTMRKKCWKKKWTPNRQYLPIMCCDFNQSGDLIALGSGNDWAAGASAAPAPAGYLLLQHVTPDMVKPPSSSGRGRR